MLEDKTVAFKGGTALSKRWDAIERFSEDIDLSIHWHDMLDDPQDEGVDWDKTNKNKSQQKKFRDGQQKRLEDWTLALAERLQTKLDSYGIEGLEVRYDEASKGEKLEISYPSVTSDVSQYHLDHILLEFGARNRGKPTEPSDLYTYISEIEDFSDMEFPWAKNVQVFDLGYIIWEKLTALHQFCTAERVQSGARLARHWYDVDCIISKALIDPLEHTQAMSDVIKMKSARWFAKGVDYEKVATGGLTIIPNGELLTYLTEDHKNMIAGGMFFNTPDDFDVILERLGHLQNSINEYLIHSLNNQQ